MKKRILCFALALSMALGSMTTDFGALSVYAEQINPEDENNQNEEGNLNPENLDEEGNDGIMLLSDDNPDENPSQDPEPIVPRIIIGDDKYVDSGIKMTVDVTVNYNDDKYQPVRKLRPTVNELKYMFSVKFGPEGDSGRTEFNEDEYSISIVSGSDNKSDKVTYQFTLPVYILEGSDSIDWKSDDPSKATRYYLPDEYYSVELNNSNTSIWRGYTPDTTPVTLSYSRDANEPKWSVTNASVSCTPKDFKDASFDVFWIYKGDSEAPNFDMSEIESKYHLYKKDSSGNFVEVTDCYSPIITKNTSNNIWTVKYENLPNNETYYLKQDKYEKYVSFNDYAIESGSTPAQEESNVKKLITNTYQKVFTVSIQWHDSDINQIDNQSRPDQATINSLLKIYRENDNEEISDVIISEPLISGNVYTYTITGDKLPAYDGSANQVIHYYVQIPKTDGKNEISVKDGFVADDNATNPRYVFTYNNEPHSTVSNLCVDNGKIAATIKADNTYESTKKWMFQLDDSAAVESFKALTDKVTLYLFRYSSNHPDMFSAVTDSQGTQYKYTLNINKDDPSLSDGVGAPFLINGQVLGINNGILEEYDEQGYRYTYFLKEVMPSGYKYRQEVYYKDESGIYKSKKTSENLDTEEYVLKGEEIRNIPTEKKDMNAEITWKSGDKSDYRKSKVYLTLQHSEDNGITWEDVDTQTAADFSTVTTTKNVVFPEVEQYTADGNRFKFRVVEKRVSYNSDDSEVVIDVEDYTHFVMNGKDYNVTGGLEYVNGKFS